MPEKNILYALLGFLVGLIGSLFIERSKQTRQRMAILDVVEWQVQSLIDACGEAAKRKQWDSSNVESFANFLHATYLRQPDLVLAIRTIEGRQNLANVYAEVTGLLGLITFYRSDASNASSAIGPGTYEGFSERCERALGLIRQSRRRWQILG
ncbi:hypothetical protein [Geobacter sp. DSM 9736]|uniref:hypothetical protein n=1 Tax=Geobacter sp. DSM 9736 TaxID=1277350 RepID=UPI000B4FE440|nr:hypothetical protein [Geobacter sp. DSM 9736]SNB47828.1 hypothetical protein SAMN06269301_3322 [Geobacter sp. DSM 9736]